MAIITHFTPRKSWETAALTGSYAGDTLYTEGFIHCSTPEQVIAVANRIARNWEDAVLLWIDEDKVGAKIVYENLEGGEMLFPHIYGPLNSDAVIGVSPFLKNENDEYILPSL